MSASGPRVAVVGAGVLGRVCAFHLARRGASVTVFEAAPHRLNASAVAAGMVAPALECALEPALHAVAAPLRAARAAWDALAAEIGVGLEAVGTDHGDTVQALADREARLRALGFAVTRRGRILHTPQDAVLSPDAALVALRRAAEAAGAAFRTARVSASDGALLADGEPLDAELVVLATGAQGRHAHLAPELGRLSPIKGQLLRWAPGPGEGGPILRTPDLYLVRSAHAVVAGATMEPGRDDLTPDPARLADLQARAERIMPELGGRPPPIPGVGVRADTPDGLPMAGPSARPGVILATGARRNGWLWAPLVARIVGAQAFGEPTPPELAKLADRLHPGRFDASEAQ